MPHVFLGSYSQDSYLCSKCETESKPPANDSPAFGLPLVRIDNKDVLPLEEAVTTELRLATLEKKLDQLLEKFTGNLRPDV